MDELERTRARARIVPARISRPADVEAGLARVRESIRGAYLAVNPDPGEDILAAIDAELEPVDEALAAPALVEAYVEQVPCVETLVATELDARTAGDRGLGRTFRRPPRFGGAFRHRMDDPLAQDHFAAVIEQMVFESYAGTAAALQSFYETPTPPSVRPAAEVFGVWVREMSAGARGLGERSLNLISLAHRASETQLLDAGRRFGLTTGFRSGKKERVLIECAGFWVGAGAALYRASAARA